jgi:chloride channel 7
MMALIGSAVGVVAFVMRNLITRLELVREALGVEVVLGPFGVGWQRATAFSLLLVAASAAINAVWHPPAAGSGIPEVIAFLNGAMLRKIFNVRTIVAKFFSCAFAVGAGMPVGPEGPMIHLGAMLGAGISQMRSGTLGFDLHWFRRFRNNKDKRDFISAGAAAGVSAAFGAPVGGLLFAMEEVSSFWNQKLGWQIFFCCMVSTTVSTLLNAAFRGFAYGGSFGFLSAKSAILFNVTARIPDHVAVFLPAALVGVLGGVLGSIFTFANLKITKWRSRVVAPHAWLRVLEPVAIMLVFAALGSFVPSVMECTRSSCSSNPRQHGGYDGKTGLSPQGTCLWAKRFPMDAHEPPKVSTLGCQQQQQQHRLAGVPAGGEFSQAATLLCSSGDDAIKHLFSRGTFHEFELPALGVFLAIYFPLACWAAGAAISSGLVVPMLLIGATYGRMVGVVLVQILGTSGAGPWVDPGVFALIGAASFFGGVSRLTMSLTVIMVEITSEVRMLLPIMTSIMVAKWVADSATHSLYHAQIEQKCIPFLDFNLNTKMSMEIFCARDVAFAPVECLHEIASVRDVARVLQLNHHAFPVQHGRTGATPYHGLVSSGVLRELLSHSEDISRPAASFHAEGVREAIPLLHFEQVSEMEHRFLHGAADDARTAVRIAEMASDAQGTWADTFIDLAPYIDTSATAVQENFSLDRTYILFRSLGLRHLVVVDQHNRPTGMVTRKDLMGFKIEERLDKVISRAHERQDRTEEKQRRTGAEARGGRGYGT